MKKRNSYYKFEDMQTLPIPPFKTYPRDNAYIKDNNESPPIDEEPLPPGFEPPKIPIEDPEKIQGWLKTQIGKYMIIDFIIGTQIAVDKAGILTTVGVDYLILQDVRAPIQKVCDLYSVKFITIFEDGPPTPRDKESFKIEKLQYPIFDTNFIQGYLRTQIGKNMLCDFIIGTCQRQDLAGTLEFVGVDYLLIKDQSGFITSGDMFSLKFVDIIETEDENEKK